jgi:hypothetical protein
MNKSLRFLLDRFAAGGDLPKVGLVLVSPSFEDAPIIAALADFEEVTGKSEAETVGKNCRFLNAGCKNDPKSLAFMRKISSSPEAAAKFRCRYPKGKNFILQNARPARTNAMGSEESMIFFHSFIHIFGYEAELRGAKHQLLAAVQHVLSGPADVAGAGARTQAVQSFLEDDRDLGSVFRQWTSKALERFVDQCGEGSSSDSTITATASHGPFYQPQLLRTLPEEQPEPVSHRDLACRIRTLMATIEQVERMAGAEKDTNKALDGDRLGQVQFDELVALRKETYRHFHADIEQFIAWYTVPVAWKETASRRDELAET